MIRLRWSASLAFVVAVALFVAGILLVLFIKPGPWTTNLRDLGSIVGGLWALSADLLAYSATGLGVSWQEKTHLREVATVCLAEIEAVWDKFDEGNVIETSHKATAGFGEKT